MIKRKIKNLIKRFLNEEASFHHYSQGGEDIILELIFRNKILKGEKGFYIDVGAYQPINMSNTYLFYKMGWRGINIEPNHASIEAFRKVRPDDLNLEIGIANQEGELPYYIIDDNSTMNSFSKDFMNEIGITKSISATTSIPVFPLQKVLNKYNDLFTEIDLLNVDVEGLDMDVLQSNDWTKYRPKVIVIEVNCKTITQLEKHDITKYLLNLNYDLVAKNVIITNVASAIFVDRDFEY